MVEPAVLTWSTKCSPCLTDPRSPSTRSVEEGAVTEFTINSSTSTGALAGAVLTSSGGSGTGFEVTLGIVNSTQVNDLNEDGILDTPIDVDGDTISDGLDLDGDGEIDLYHYLVGGLFDPYNTTDNEVNNFEGQGIGADLDGDDPGYLNADDPGGYYRFYDALALANSITTPVEGQNEARYDGGAGEGTFVGGSGYEISDTITLADYSVVRVDDVLAGVVTEFTLTASDSSTGAIAGTNLVQSSTSGTGSGFTLTVQADNISGLNTGYTQGDLQEDVPLVPEFTIVFYAQVEIEYDTEIVVTGGGSDSAVNLTDELSNYNYLSFTNIATFAGDPNLDGIFDNLDPVTGLPIDPAPAPTPIPIRNQDHGNYDNAGGNGTFAGGAGGYVVDDTITLSDGTTITVDAVDGSGAVTEFTVNSNSATIASAAGATLTQTATSGVGTLFTLTVEAPNLANPVTEVLPATHAADGVSSDAEFITLIAAEVQKAVVALNADPSDPANAISIFNRDNLDPDQELDLFDRVGDPEPDGSIDGAQVRIGDTVTYRVTTTLPYAAGEEIILRDFLPLPVFNLSEDYAEGMVRILDFNGDTNGNLPNAYLASDGHADGAFIEWAYGPQHDVDLGRIVQSDGVTPVDLDLEFDPTPNLGAPEAQVGTVYFDPLNNTIIWNFGTWSELDDANPNTSGATIDILFTVKVNEEPFADGLFLTNQSELEFANSLQEVTTSNAIILVEVLGPEVHIRKGVVAVSPSGSGDGGLLTSDGTGDALSSSGANSEFAPYGHDEDNDNPFGALDTDLTTTAEELIFGSLAGTIQINGDFGAANQTFTTGQRSGQILVYLDNFGEAITLFEDEFGDLIQQDTGTVVGEVLAAETGQISIDISELVVITPASISYSHGPGLTPVAGEALPSTTNGVMATPQGLANTDIAPGTVRLQVGSGDNTDTFFDDGNGNLISPDFINSGTIDYVTGEITAFSFDHSPQLYGSDSAGFVRDGVFTGYLEESNIVPESPVITLNHYGTLLTFTTSGVTSTNALDQELGNVLNGAVDIGDINFTTGLVTLDVRGQLISDVEIAYNVDSGGALVSVLAEDNDFTAADNATTTGLLAAGRTAEEQEDPVTYNANIIAGTVELTLSGDPNGFLAGFPDKLLTDNNGIDPINGTLYLQNGESPDVFIAVGTINYVTGAYEFELDTFASQPPILADYDYASAVTAATLNTTMTDGEMTAQVLTTPLIGGSVVVTVGTGNGAVTLLDNGNGAIIDSNNLVVGVIDYDTGDIDIYGDPTDLVNGDRFHEVFNLTAVYEINSGPGRVNSDYLHGVTDLEDLTQLERWAKFVDSNLIDVDSGEVITFGIFVENVGGGNAFDVVITDAFFDGPLDFDGLQFSATTFTDSDGTDVDPGTGTAYDLSELNFQITTGDGVVLLGSAEDIDGTPVTLGAAGGGTDFVLFYTPGTVNATATISGGTITAGNTITLPPTNTFVPESLEISVINTGAVGEPYHVTISDFEVSYDGGSLSGFGDLRDHDLNIIGFIDYRSGVATFGQQLTYAGGVVAVDGNGDAITAAATIPVAYAGFAADSITYHEAAFQSGEILESGVSSAGFNGNIRASLDHTNVVPNTVEIVIFESVAVSADPREMNFAPTTITVRDDGTGILYAVDPLPGLGATADPANGVPPGFSAELINGVPSTVTIAGTTHTTIGTIDYASGQLDIRLKVGWDMDADFIGTNATGLADTHNGQATNAAGEVNGSTLTVRDENIGAAGTVLPGTVLVTVEDPLDRGTGGFDPLTNQVFTDSGDGSLLNGDEVPVGSIDYVNGTISFNASLRDSDDSNPVDFLVGFDTVTNPQVAGPANVLVVDDGVLFSVNGFNPAGLDPLAITQAVIVPGTVNITDLTGVHGALTDDGEGNLLNVNGVRVGTIRYADHPTDGALVAGTIDFSVIETLSLDSDYATANVFQIDFDDSIDHDANNGTADRLGILQAGRVDPATDGGLPTNESGSNVLVITYDLQLSDDWQPDEQFTNEVALESYATADGVANIIDGARETDTATVEGRDVEVEKFLMATNHESTGVFSVFDEELGIFGVVDSSLLTPEVVALAQQNIVPGSVQLSFPGSETYIVDFGSSTRTVPVAEAFELVDDGFGNLINSVYNAGYQAWSHFWNYFTTDRGLPLNGNTLVWGAANGHNNIIPGTWTFDRQDTITDFLDDPAGIERNVTSYDEVTINSGTGAIVAEPGVSDIQTTGGLLLKQVDRELYGIPFGGYGFNGTSQSAGTVFNLLAPPESDPTWRGFYDQSISTLYLDSRLSPGSITLEVTVGSDPPITLTDQPLFGSVSIGDDATTFNTGTGVMLDSGLGVIANIDYETGEVVFIAGNLNVTNLIASYESYFGTLDYEDGSLDINNDPNFLSNNVFNPDGQFSDHNSFGDNNVGINTVRYDRLVGSVDYVTGEIDIVQDFNTHNHALNGDVEHYEAIIDYQYSSGTTTDRIPNPDNPPGTLDVTVGEEVVYGILVTLPEGTTEELVISDQLPAGLELLDIQVVTTVARSEGLLETDFALAGSFPAFELVVGGLTIPQADIQWGHPGDENDDNDPTNFPNDHGDAAGVDAPYAILGGNIQIRFLDGVVNPHDDPQDDDLTDPTDPIDSAQNNSFLLKLTTRVMNDLEYDPTANQADPADSGVNDLDPLDGDSIALTGTSLGKETGSPLGNYNGSLITNVADVTYTTGLLGQDASGDPTLNSVNSVTDELNIEIVEPDLEIDKIILGATARADGLNGDATDLDDFIANVGQRIAYQITVSHSDSSTADAFNLNVADLIMATNENPATLEETFEMVRFTIQSSGTSLNGGASLSLYDADLGGFQTPAIGTNATYILPEMFSFDGSGNIVAFNFAAFELGLDPDADAIDFGGNAPGASTPHDLEGGGYANNGEASFDLNFAQLPIGESLVITYVLDIPVNLDLNDNDLDGNDADQNDVENVVDLTWYSLPDTATDNITLTGSNPEVREYAASDAVALELIGPDVDLALVKTVLAVTPASSDPQSFTQDANPNNDSGPADGTFDDANFVADVNTAAANILASLNDLGLPGTITSLFLHPGMNDAPTPNMAWNAAIDRDLLSEDGGVDAGDVVTYAVFIESQGMSAVFDIVVEDVLGLLNLTPEADLNPAGALSNVNVILGNGTVLTEGTHFFQVYDAGSDTLTWSFASLFPVNGQTEADYDGAPVTEGTFTGGDGAGVTAYVAADTITLSDGSVVTVNSVDGNGDVVTFTIDSSTSTGAIARDTLTQASTSGAGTGFQLDLLGGANVGGRTTGAATIDVTANNTFTRTDGGDFQADGFFSGHTITTSNFTDAANNGTFTIASVTPGAITIDETTLVSVETGNADEQITASPYAILAAGRESGNEEEDPINNTTGNNILVITFDLTINNEIKPVDSLENTATITRFTDSVSARDSDFPALLTDSALVEGRAVDMEKFLVSTDLDHTDAAFTDLAVDFEGAPAQLEGAVLNIGALDIMPDNASLLVGSVSVTLNDGSDHTYFEIGTSALLETGLTTVVSSDGPTGFITLGADDIIAGTLVLDTATLTLDNGLVKDSGGSIVGSYINGAADQTTVALVPGSFASVTSASYNREIADINYSLGTITFTEDPLGAWPLASQTVSFERTFQQATTADVTPGEEVVYDILVDIPEGTTDDLVITDQLPDGLEALRLDIITLAVNSPNLDVDYGGGVPNIVSVNGDGTLNGTSITLTPNDTIQGDVVIDFGDLVNAPDVTQNAASTQNNSFIIRLTARVLNGLQYNPASNGTDPTEHRRHQ